MIYYKINDDKCINFNILIILKTLWIKLWYIFTNQLNENFLFNYKIVIINLLFKPYFFCGKCLLKRHFSYKPNFLKLWKAFEYNSIFLVIMEGVSWRDTFSINSKFSTVWMKIMESVFWRDTLSINPIFLKLLKVSRDTFHNSQKIKLY